MRLPVPEGKTLLYMPVIIIDEQGFEVTKKCLESLKETAKDYWLVIAHNDADTIGEKGEALLREHADYYFKYHNPDSSFGATLGLAMIFNSVLWGVCIHNDVYFNPGWLEAIREQMARPEVGVSSILFTLGDKPRETKEFLETNRVAGCCWAIRAEVIEKVGWWEERAGFGDADYWIRCIAAGYEVHINHKVFVYHKSFMSFNKLYPSGELQTKMIAAYKYMFEKWKGKETYGFTFKHPSF